MLAEMAAICRRHGVLFIADEVMTGWGRTGTLLACQQAGVAPDILCLAKGLTGGAMPLAVTMASEAVYERITPPTARDLLPFLQLHRQPGRLRRRQRQSRHLARGTGGAAHRRARRRAGPRRGHAGAGERHQRVRQCGTILALDYEVEGAGYLSRCNRACWPSSARPGC
jgi:adenosylmethionine-8-amino-7-oxononanoate aminotransferase